MHFSVLFGTSAMLWAALAATSPIPGPVDANELSIMKDIPFKLTPLFTVDLDLGTPSKPIPVTGGVRITEDIVGGTATGPALNATIKGGVAYPRILEQGTIQAPEIVIYGNTDDGEAFSISEVGIGSPEAQVTRIRFSIGGGDKYKVLRDGYVLASVNPNSDRTKVAVRGYEVTNVAGFESK